MLDARAAKDIHGCVRSSKPVEHGTTYGYSHHRCRCDACLQAIRKYQRGRRANPPALPPNHRGNANYYSHYGCRCNACRRAHADERMRLYRKHQEERRALLALVRERVWGVRAWAARHRKTLRPRRNEGTA